MVWQTVSSNLPNNEDVKIHETQTGFFQKGFIVVPMFRPDWFLHQTCNGGEMDNLIETMKRDMKLTVFGELSREGGNRIYIIADVGSVILCRA